MPTPRVPRLGIRAWMLIASMLAAVPLLLFSAFSVYRLVAEQREQERLAVEQRATAASAAVRRRMERAMDTLQAMAASGAARQGDMAALHAQALRVMADHPDAVAISVTRPDGTQLFATLRPFGDTLPPSAAAPHERPVFDERRAVVTPVFRGSVSGRLAVGVSIPLDWGHGIHSLRMNLPVETLGDIIREQRWPAAWVVSLVDQRGVFIARSQDAERLVGTPASESLRQAIDARHAGAFDARTLEGMPVIGYIARVPGTDWHIAVGVRRDAFRRELWRSLAPLLGAGLLCLLAGAGGALWIAGIVGRQVGRLADGPDGAHEAHGAHSVVREVHAVSDALARARGREAQLSQALADAHHDALTGLPGRALFHDLAARKLARAAGKPNRRVAVLFIDLDGFKQVNDRLGHDRGDAVLREVAQVIRRVVRNEDVAGRLGGDEFAVCLGAAPETVGEVARGVAARLVAEVRGIGHGLGCSVGIAVAPPGTRTLDALIARADQAMLRAKRAGKNTFVMADADAAS